MNSLDDCWLCSFCWLGVGIVIGYWRRKRNEPSYIQRTIRSGRRPGRSWPKTRNMRIPLFDYVSLREHTVEVIRAWRKVYSDDDYNAWWFGGCHSRFSGRV